MSEHLYLGLLRQIARYGELKENRTGVDTFACPTMFFSHNMSDGFPLITTKKMAHKSIFTELEGFIGGITDKRWYQERGCKIWNQWHSEGGDDHDLGPIYGYQWRRYDMYYRGARSTKFAPLFDSHYDQLANLIHKLKTNPNDRRMVVSAWNPGQLPLMALPACHTGFTVQHINGTIHLTWTQRSCDMFLGIPFNIASYAMLLLLIAKETGMKAGNLYGVFIDAHVYENHIDQVEEQTDRRPYDCPTVKIDNWTDIWNWEAADVVLEGYQHHPKITGEVAI